jgi:predicted metal-dependent enzyme (double-stranded beta helix superfamily)
MNKINHTGTLHEAISLLKMQQVGQLDQLKEQYQHTYAHYKPTNILKRYLNNLTSYAVFKGNIMIKPHREKTVYEQVNYGFDYKNTLDTDENIASSTWEISEPELTAVYNSHDDETTSIYVTGGNIGVIYTLTNKIITDSSPVRKFEESFSLKITS